MQPPQQPNAPVASADYVLVETVDWMLAKLGSRIVMAAPLGLGKPNRLGENTTDLEVYAAIVAHGTGSKPFTG